MFDADVIIVGGGHNGLICGTYLAQSGMKAILLEARETVGGCASTVSDLGAKFNICSCDHSLIRAMPLLDELNLFNNGLEYLEPEATYVNAFHDCKDSWVSFYDPERTLEGLSKTHPKEVSNYKNYLDDAIPLAQLAIEIAKSGVSTREFMSKALLSNMSTARRLLRWSRASALDILKSYFTDWRLMMPAISTGPTVWGAPPEAPGTGMGAIVYATRHLIQSGRPRGGSGSLPDSLSRSFESSDGSVLTSSTVSGLLVDKKKIVGVRLENGGILTAPVVVAACDPHRVFIDWLDEIPKTAKKLVDNWKNIPVPEGYESKLDGILNKKPTYRFMPKLQELFPEVDLDQSTVIISPTIEKLNEAHVLKARGEVSATPTMLASFPSILDPSMKADNGLHTFSLEVLFTPYSLKGGWSHSGEPEKWLNTWGELMSGDFLETITEWRAMTPDIYEKDFYMLKGHSPAYNNSPLATLFGKQRELSRYTTPIDGLFLTGAGTFPGAGIFGAPGRNAAMKVLESVKGK